MLGQEETKKAPHSSSVQRWAVGIAVTLCGLGAWRYANLPAHRGRPLARGSLEAELPELVETEAEESLEDILNKLEGKVGKPAEQSSVASKRKAERKPKAKEALNKLEGRTSAEEGRSKTMMDGLYESFVGGERSAKKERAADTELLTPDDVITRAIKEMAAPKRSQATKKKAKKAKAIKKDTLDPLDMPDGIDPEILLQKLEQDEGDSGNDLLDASHLEFAKRLQEESEKQLDFDLKHVKDDFKREFPAAAKPLLCSSCKLVAARIGTELDSHDVHDQETPAEMLSAKRKALDATCKSFRLEAAQEGKSAKQQLPQRLCMALLEDAKFDMMAKLIRRKVPTMSDDEDVENSKSHNWERFLCAQRARLCKRSEVRDDDEEL